MLHHLYNNSKYLEGTSDATTSSLLVPLILMSIDDFLSSKTAIIVVRKSDGRSDTVGPTDGRTYGQTQPLTDMGSRIKKLKNKKKKTDINICYVKKYSFYTPVESYMNASTSPFFSFSKPAVTLSVLNGYAGMK